MATKKVSKEKVGKTVRRIAGPKTMAARPNRANDLRGDAVDSAQSMTEQVGVVVQYVCAECGTRMSVNRSRAYPSFMQRELRCNGCGRHANTQESRQVRVC